MLLTTRSLVRFAVIGTLVLTMVSVSGAENWSRFRGPNGTGTSDLKGVPATWTVDDYEWVIDLPGKGHSSPVVWGDRLFLTTGFDDGARTLLCLNADTGETLWSDSYRLGTPRLHKKNSFASGTPTVDADRVYVVFADDEHNIVTAYTHQGEKVWTRDVGAYRSQHGPGVSPILVDGLLILPNDQLEFAQIVALDAETGEIAWATTDRKYRRSAYSSPLVVNVNGQDQLICLSGAVGLSAFNPRTGEELWASGELEHRTVGSPVYDEKHNLLIATCGGGGIGKYMVAVDPTGQGDLSQTEFIKGERTQNLPYVPTPIVHEGHLYLWNDNGVVCCVDLSGDVTENVWRERIGGNYTGSPVLIDGRIYCISEDGEVVVIDASPKFKLHGKSPLGDPSYSTPAVANGRVYFRGFHTLASLKAGSATGTLSQ